MNTGETLMIEAKRRLIFAALVQAQDEGADVVLRRKVRRRIHADLPRRRNPAVVTVSLQPFFPPVARMPNWIRQHGQ